MKNGYEDKILDTCIRLSSEGLLDLNSLTSGLKQAVMSRSFELAQSKDNPKHSQDYKNLLDLFPKKRKEKLYFCVKTQDGEIWDIWKAKEVDESFVERLCHERKFTYQRVTTRYYNSWRKSLFYDKE